MKSTNRLVYSHIVDLNERGQYKCHVENANGKVVWEASNEPDDEGDSPDFWPVTDGFMKHVNDMNGLTVYLQTQGIMPQNSRLINCH